MITRFGDGGELPPADVLVVGAGAAGLSLAYGIAENGGNVLVVESGHVDVDATVAELNDGESIGHPHAGLRVGRVRALGGTTKVWPGQSLRLHESDLAGWPLRPGELEEPYRRAEAFLRCGAPANADEIWRRSGLEPLPESTALDYVASTYARQRDLGARLRRDLERHPQIRVLLGATAVRLSGSGDRVDGVELGDLHGRRAVATASRVVVAAGGIENARLLLVSGVGGDAVGRYFHDHCAATVGRIVTSDAARLADLFGVFARRTGQAHVKLALTASEQRRRDVPGCSASLIVRAADDDPVSALLRLRRRALRRAPWTGAGDDVLRVLRAPAALASTVNRRRRGLGPAVRPVGIDLLCIAEQEPDAESRITLSDDRDALGVPRTRLDWRVGEAERRAIGATADAVDGWLRELRLGSLDRSSWLDGHAWREHLSDTFHHMGGTRMHDDPREGVVDADCRVHGVENLYVAGSSVFPTGGYANPTLTIVALALRLADHLQPPR